MTAKYVHDLLAISAEVGAIAEAATHAARANLRIVDLANGLQVSIAHFVSQSMVDGDATLNDVREALGKAPLTQEGGTPVAVVEGSHPEAPGVGKGSADRGPSAEAGGSRHAPEADQALTEGDAESPTSNPEPASPLEDAEDALVREIVARQQTTRSTVIDLWHESMLPLTGIAILCRTDESTILTWLQNARRNGDARVTRGDEKRGIVFATNTAEA